MRLELYLAIRFLREGWKQSLLLTLAGAVGITVLFFVTALITAVERTMISQTLGIVPDVIIRRPEVIARPTHQNGPEILRQDIQPAAQPLRSIQDWRAVSLHLEALEEIRAVSPSVEGAAVAVAAGARRSVALMGVEPDRIRRVIELDPKLIAGSLDLNGGTAAIGRGLADDLGLVVGERFRVTVGGTGDQTLRVSGILDLGSASANDRWVLVPLRRAQALLGVPGGVSALSLRVQDLWLADQVARRVEFETGLDAEAWTESNAQLEIAIGSQRGATLMIRAFVMIAVAMGIASVLIVSTLQKSRQIGIIRAIGGTRSVVLRVFLLQGVLIGAGGGLLGTAGGTVLSLASMAGARNPDGAPTYPIELPVTLYVMAFTLAVITGTLAAVLPARAAARLDPAVAIRHE